MYYWTENDSAELVVYTQAKTLKDMARHLQRLQKAWPEKYEKSMKITVCKRKQGRMIWFGDYEFGGNTLKAIRKANPLLEAWGLV